MWRGRWRGSTGILSQRERFRDFVATGATAPVQTQIDTDLWTSKGKSAKEDIGQA
jgi:hypothetical protein